MSLAASMPLAPEDGLHHLANKIDQLLPPSANKLAGLKFELDGIQIIVRHCQENGHSHFTISAVLGHFPYTAESVERRMALQYIIVNAKPSVVRFSIDHENRITASAEYDFDNIQAPDFVFYPLMLFLQEAQPFFEVIGKHL